ncbi:ArsR/SmtB family transcription factor [Oceanobacter mangrovi]|uniref:ArsR/SmtB family transcription factor n=1 Tax=Oceanobacter mangrovi TaxID=2862510 RepID=UPI001C8DE93B|nr:metalloregulator ArsR/SmtB family transcription factor [Oceanobacter mangrovi]
MNESFIPARHTVVRMLKALANEHRLAIMCLLRNGEVSVHDMLCQLPVSQSALSQHLACLREENLVASRKEAQCVFYRLNDDRVAAVIQLINQLYSQDQQ